MDRRVAGHQHIGQLGERAQRPHLLRRPGGRVGGEQKGGEIRRDEIAVAGGERLDGAALAGCAPGHRDRTQTHRFRDPLDQVLVLHHQDRQRDQIERPQHPQLGGLGVGRPGNADRRDQRCRG